MSVHHIPHDLEPAVERTLLQQAHEEGNRAGDGWPVPGAVLSTRDMAQLTRFAFVADVLLGMLLADVTNEAMVGGERLSNRARSALGSARHGRRPGAGHCIPDGRSCCSVGSFCRGCSMNALPRTKLHEARLALRTCDNNVADQCNLIVALASAAKSHLSFNPDSILQVALLLEAIVEKAQYLTDTVDGLASEQEASSAGIDRDGALQTEIYRQYHELRAAGPVLQTARAKS